jgi:hypothetical protein
MGDVGIECCGFMIQVCCGLGLGLAVWYPPVRVLNLYISFLYNLVFYHIYTSLKQIYFPVTLRSHVTSCGRTHLIPWTESRILSPVCITSTVKSRLTYYYVRETCDFLLTIICKVIILRTFKKHLNAALKTVLSI